MYAIVCLISQSIYVVNISVQGIQDNIDTNIYGLVVGISTIKKFTSGRGGVWTVLY